MKLHFTTVMRLLTFLLDLLILYDLSVWIRRSPRMKIEAFKLLIWKNKAKSRTWIILGYNINGCLLSEDRNDPEITAFELHFPNKKWIFEPQMYTFYALFRAKYVKYQPKRNTVMGTCHDPNTRENSLVESGLAASRIILSSLGLQLANRGF